jgi:hypothetical protein
MVLTQRSKEMRTHILGLLVAIGAVTGCGDAEQTKVPANVTPAVPAVADTNKAVADTTKIKVVYTCPMHPQVRVSAPGRCPTCGMNLVKAARDTSAHVNHTH